ncbi:hydantoinase [Candidatus Tenderia electrophaga]|jgi:N-methylhydantoinase A|uniref:Hydantoinase n=1 Tax=Candidatus Tenderia electrophaga TaxID=1748243 RepID=A0A0S2T9B1_9GAMM|nr:hydantoinase [Candidatus Tenderia electrophaga]
MLLGIDTGGTFTDFVLFDGRALRLHKRLSTPQAPEEAILGGIADLGLDPAQLTIIHGSTVATNAALEGKGVRTAFITNRGFGDMLSIGRQARRELYDLQPEPVAPPVPPDLCLETGGRIAADGTLLEALSADDLKHLREQLQQLKPEAVAINLLFSFIDARAEQAIEDIVPKDIFVSRSSAILPEYKEYERGITTWLNAWIGPRVEQYLQRLQHGLPQTPIAVMQSSGGTLAAAQAGRLAVHMLLSGPAGGLAGARYIGALAGHERLLTFDMGGTSTDVALIDGEPRLTSEGHIGPYPVAVPMVDMHTIGAGGGSIAWIDAGGLLQVGPESAGADPGPACYGRGGAHATVTDANLLLGRLRPDAFLGGEMPLDPDAAHAAVRQLAHQLKLSIEDTAEGIIRIADEHMGQALRVISIQRGMDPRAFTLMPFGGAGGLHVCALAEALGMDRALVPIQGGVLSAFGMLVARRSRELSHTIAAELEHIHAQTLEQEFQNLEQKALAALADEGIAAGQVSLERSLDLRYRGQAFSLNIPWQGLAHSGAAFHQTHEQRYGHRLQHAVELVNIRLRAHGPAPELHIPVLAKNAAPGAASDEARLHGISQPVSVLDRARLAAGQQIDGPALITETVATTLIADHWRCRVDDYGNLLLTRQHRRSG